MIKQDINALRIRLLVQSSCAEMNAQHDYDCSSAQWVTVTKLLLI